MIAEISEESWYAICGKVIVLPVISGEPGFTLDDYLVCWAPMWSKLARLVVTSQIIVRAGDEGMRQHFMRKVLSALPGKIVYKESDFIGFPGYLTYEENL